MEEYAASLEQEVEERTRELTNEKKKADVLLYRMLPRQVVDKLKLGELVEPEQFQVSEHLDYLNNIFTMHIDAIQHIALLTITDLN